MMKVSSFLVIAAFFVVAVAGSGPSEATDMTRNSSRQRRQAVTSARGVRGLLSRKGAGISFNAQARGTAAHATDRRVQKVKKHLRDRHKRPSGGRLTGISKLPNAGGRKMLRPPCVTARECAATKSFCFKKCSGVMKMQEDPKCLIKCVKCIPTC